MVVSNIGLKFYKTKTKKAKKKYHPSPLIAVIRIPKQLPMMLTKEKIIPKWTKFRLVEIDGSDSWDEELLARCGGRITTVYLYDGSQVTYCAEITPSFELHPLYYNISPLDPSFKVSEDAAEEVGVETIDSEEITYMHCRDIEARSIRVKGTGVNQRYYTPDGIKHREIMEETIEMLKCNRQL